MAQASEIFIQSMREVRTSEGLSQVKLAARVSEILGRTLDGTAITRIEKGQRPLQLDEASAIAKALGMTLFSMIPSEHSVEEQIELLEQEEAETQAGLDRLDEQRHEVRTSLTVLELQLQELRDRLAGQQ